MAHRAGAAVQRRKGTEPRPRAAAKKEEEGAAAAASRDDVSGMKKRIVAKGARPRAAAKPRPRAAAKKKEEEGAAAAASRDDVSGMKKGIVAKGARPRAAAKPRPRAARKSYRALTAKEVMDMKGKIVSEGKVYVGIDLHKLTLQIAVEDEAGTFLEEVKILNSFDM